jgi:hypothetical protein
MIETGLIMKWSMTKNEMPGLSLLKTKTTTKTNKCRELDVVGLGPRSDLSLLKVKHATTEL